MFWNDPNLYGLTFKDVVPPQVPFLGSTQPWMQFQGIEPWRALPRFTPPYTPFGMTPHVPPQLGMVPQFPPQFGIPQFPPQFGMIPQFPPQLGMVPQFPPQLGMVPQFPPQLGMIPQFPHQFGMTSPYFNPPITPFPPFQTAAIAPYFQPYPVNPSTFHPYRPFTL